MKKSEMKKRRKLKLKRTNRERTRKRTNEFLAVSGKGMKGKSNLCTNLRTHNIFFAYFWKKCEQKINTTYQTVARTAKWESWPSCSAKQRDGKGRGL